MNVQSRTLKTTGGTMEEITITQGDISAVVQIFENKASACFNVEAFQAGYDEYDVTISNKNDALDFIAVLQEAYKYLKD